jgi:hypothetical protein
LQPRCHQAMRMAWIAASRGHVDQRRAKAHTLCDFPCSPGEASRAVAPRRRAPGRAAGALRDQSLGGASLASGRRRHAAGVHSGANLLRRGWVFPEAERVKGLVNDQHVRLDWIAPFLAEELPGADEDHVTAAYRERHRGAPARRSPVRRSVIHLSDSRPEPLGQARPAIHQRWAQSRCPARFTGSRLLTAR